MAGQKIDVKKTFGISLKTWRRQRGFSQEELSERSKLHRTYISDVERGARNLSLESITRLAAALAVPVGALFPAELADAGDGLGQVHNSGQELVDIVLVEDNADDVELTLHAFKQARFANRVQVIADGQEALDYFFARESFPSGCPRNVRISFSWIYHCRKSAGWTCCAASRPTTGRARSRWSS
jgi:transcriptional regulator with XRE-family HTH domain